MEDRQEDPQFNDVAQSTALGADDAAGENGRGGPAVHIRRRRITTANLLYAMRAPRWAIDAEVGILTFDAAINGDEARVEAIKQATKERKWIGIVGRSPGRGKTHLGLGALWASWYYDLRLSYYNDDVPYGESRAPHTYRFARADVLLQKMVMAGISYDELHEEAAGFRCLMLDEVGRNMNGQRADIFYALTGDIYDRGGQLIWTAPFTKLELTEKLDGAFLDRANQGLIVELPPGKSYRGHKPTATEGR